jgi:hypothetical protein
VRRWLRPFKARRLLLVHQITYLLFRIQGRSSLGRSGFARMVLKATIGRMGTNSIGRKIAKLDLLLRLIWFRIMW